MISTFTAFIDSNVFYGARLRSLILYLAVTGLFRVRWSKDVHREWMRNVVENRPDLSMSSLEQTRGQMDAAVLDCLVTGYEPLIDSLNLPDKDDRHILAAAITGKAECIVTFNQRHFPSDVLKPYNIQTCHPDDFLLDVFDIDERACLWAVQQDIGHYKNPPLTVDDYLASLEKAGVPKVVGFLGERKIVFE